MQVKLMGVDRISFKNSDGEIVEMGHLYVLSDFDEDQDECAGQQVAKMNFDYNATKELMSLTFPCSVELEMNIKGKVKKVILKKNDVKTNDGK